jgi:hypothetical protein
VGRLTVTVVYHDVGTVTAFIEDPYVGSYALRGCRERASAMQRGLCGQALGAVEQSAFDEV